MAILDGLRVQGAHDASGLVVEQLPLPQLACAMSDGWHKATSTSQAKNLIGTNDENAGSSATHRHHAICSTSQYRDSSSSMALSTACIISCETGLSATMTSSGLFEEARSSPQLPSCSATRSPFTVIRVRMDWPANLPPLRRQPVHAPGEVIDHPVFGLVRAGSAHGGGTPRRRQSAIKIGHGCGDARSSMRQMRTAANKPSS
jgi:hypothetical protein